MGTERLHSCLTRLIPHLDQRRVALTGGIAIALHVGSRRRRPPGADEPVGDVDFVADAADAVDPTVTEDFLVAHFHAPQPGYAKFLIQLVDPVSRLRIDVFPDTLAGLTSARRREVAGISLLVLEPCCILDHKLAILAGASERSPAEEKHYRDAQLLGPLCGRAIPVVPATRLGRAVYSRDLAVSCARCDASRDPRFPLASKRQVRDILGYV